MGDTSGNLTMLGIVYDKIEKPDCILLCFDGGSFDHERQISSLKKEWLPKIQELGFYTENFYLVVTKLDNIDAERVKAVKLNVQKVFGKRYSRNLYFVSSATEQNVKNVFDDSLISVLENC